MGRRIFNFRFINLAALILIISGLVHLVIFAITQEAFAGSTSIRKPILFGISTGLTIFSIGMIAAYYLRDQWQRILEWVVGISAIIEVAFITLQYWRGVPSHFNRTTWLNARIDDVVYYTVMVLLTAVLYQTILVLWKKPVIEIHNDMKLAIQSGMLFLTFSCLFGLWMVFYGESQAAKGLPPGVYKNEGILKFVHGCTIHAIQLLPLLSWAYQKLSFPLNQRLCYIWISNAGHSGLLLFSLMQTLAGRPRMDFTILSLSVFLISVILFIISFALPILVRFIKAIHPKKQGSIHEAV